ncbi:hypothetical protein EG327_008520 [Venturia inaequalis]|uniref:Cyclohexanone monooxygenase n=1 Tax=Venturia inaequalis TaxID=5025 RepID=A0A8H3YZE2_VENIN|nr:hypothetical protein EG327_008520 [Venturia inaequalis]
MTRPEEQVIDALVVGAGFGGIYQVKKLRDQGLNVIGIDLAGDVGGTWYWNRYPGAMSDTESFLYRYSWDLEDLKTYPWSHRYVQGPDILKYLNHVVERHDLRRSFRFNTELISANWEESSERWIIATSTGITYKARYLITALGLLSKQNFPDIEGLESYEGEMYHTARWPETATLQGKRVAVIGNGSTGVQVITDIAKDVKHLISFQRNPQYSVPSGDAPATPEYRQKVNDNYQELWKKAKDDELFGFGFTENVDRPLASVTKEERDAIFEKAWNQGGGFRFMFETFNDITTNVDANIAAQDFIKNKIRQTVTDPEKARKLLPTQYYARRPLCDGGYYKQFNRDNVSVVSLKDTPITTITPKGIKTSDGVEHEVDMIIFATGFDAVDGNYTRCQIKGRNGKSLKDHWSVRGATSYLGLSIPGFPNLFMITGPNGPFSNIPPAVETHVEFISAIIDSVDKTSSTRKAVVKATEEAEEGWTDLCDEISKNSLFRKTDSWIFGANIAGKKNSVLFFFGGLGPYRKILRDVVEKGYKGYKPFLEAAEPWGSKMETKQADEHIEFANQEENSSAFTST